MSDNFHLAHFSPEELHILMKASGDGPLPGTNVIHLKNLEHMMRNPKVRQEIIHNFHDMVSKGYHPHYDELAQHHKKIIKKTGGHPALVGHCTGRVLNHLMGGGQPEGEPRKHYFLGKLVRGAANAAKRVTRGVTKTIGRAAQGARKVVRTAGKIAGKVSGVSNVVRKVHPGAANALDKGAATVQKGTQAASGMIDKGEAAANTAVNNVADRGQSMANSAIEKGQSMIPGAAPAPAPMPQPQPIAAAKRGGRLHLAHQFMRHKHAEGEEVEREHHGKGLKVLGKIAKAGLNAAAKVSPTARLVKKGVGAAKKFAGSKAGKTVLKGAKTVASSVKAKQQENKADAAPQESPEAEAA